MRKYGNNMKCSFIRVLMNLVNGEEPTHNFLPSKLRGKKLFMSVILESQHTVMHVYQIAQWDAGKHSCSPAVSHEWSRNWENIFAIKKCGDINPFQGRFPTPMTYHWSTWFWWFTLGFSIHGVSSFPPATVISVGRGCLHHRLNHSWNLERTFPVRARRVLFILMLFGRIVDWMMVIFPDDILIR